jgi:hypothetical protein
MAVVMSCNNVCGGKEMLKVACQGRDASFILEYSFLSETINETSPDCGQLSCIQFKMTNECMYFCGATGASARIKDGSPNEPCAVEIQHCKDQAKFALKLIACQVRAGGTRLIMLVRGMLGSYGCAGAQSWAEPLSI